MLGKLASAAKEAAIAWRYGVHPSVDAYVFLSNLITTPISVWFSLLTVILVPLQAQSESGLNRAESHLFKRELLGFSMAVGLAFTVIAYFGIPLILQAGWSGLQYSAYDEALSMAGGMSLLIPSGVLISLFSAQLLAHGNHRNTLLEAVPAILVLAFILLPENSIAQPLVWGTVIGFVAQMLFLKLAIQRRDPVPAPILGFRSQAWSGLWQSMGFVAMGQMAMGLTGLVDNFFAAKLDSGAISILSYANRLLSMVLSMCVLTISRATLPIFSKATVAGDVDVAALTNRWRNMGFMAGTGIAAIAWLLAPVCVALVFERGAFDSHDTVLVSQALQFGLLQLPFYIAGIIVYSANSGMQKYRQNGISMLIAVAFKIAAVWTLTPLLGIKGIQLSTAIMYLVFFVALVYTSDRGSNGAK